MNMHNPAQPYFRPMRFRQQVRKQKAFSLPGEKELWISIGKMLLVLCPMVLAVNLWLASSFNNLEASVLAVENVRNELMDSQIHLRAKRAQLFSPERVQALAAEKLSLHVPGKEQVKSF
jgi:hypothetical protein